MKPGALVWPAWAGQRLWEWVTSHLRDIVHDSVLRWLHMCPWLIQGYEARPLPISRAHFTTLEKQKCTPFIEVQYSREQCMERWIFSTSVPKSLLIRFLESAQTFHWYFKNLYKILQMQNHTLKRGFVCFVLCDSLSLRWQVNIQLFLLLLLQTSVEFWLYQRLCAKSFKCIISCNSYKNIMM